MKTRNEPHQPTESYWISTTHSKSYPKLTQDISVDVAIVGGGITGITTAYSLLRTGKKIAIVEQNRIAQGETGHTTAHVTAILDTRYSELLSNFGKDHAKLIYQSKLSAIHQIKKWVQNLKIECSFKQVPAYLYTTSESDQDDITKEKEACEELGIPAELIQNIPLPFAVANAIKFKDQYQINASQYVNALTAHCEEKGCLIFENSHVLKIEDLENEDRACQLTTPYGTIYADQVVMATNSPTQAGAFTNTKVAAYRTYAIATHLHQPPHEEALYWDTADPYHYIRKSEHLWIIGGEDHKVGQITNTNERLRNLEKFSKEHFKSGSPHFTWSGQILEPVDGLAYIGHIPGKKNRYMATGFSGNGITFGTLSGMIISDLIQGKENQYSAIYDPHRINLLASLPAYLEENKDFPICYIKDRITKSDVTRVEDIKNEMGGTVEIEGRRVAAYRDKKGKLHTYSCVCPHQGCHVHWNQMEKTWDCPCHGSRFDTQGKVLNGPALTNLEHVEITGEQVKKTGS